MHHRRLVERPGTPSSSFGEDPPGRPEPEVAPFASPSVAGLHAPVRRPWRLDGGLGGGTPRAKRQRRRRGRKQPLVEAEEGPGGEHRLDAAGAVAASNGAVAVSRGRRTGGRAARRPGGRGRGGRGREPRRGRPRARPRRGRRAECGRPRLGDAGRGQAGARGAAQALGGADWRARPGTATARAGAATAWHGPAASARGDEQHQPVVPAQGKLENDKNKAVAG